MSRIGKRPISIPKKVSVTIDGQAVAVKGPKGELSRVLPSEVTMEQSDGKIVVKRDSESRKARSRHGLSRTLVANMIEGVDQGFKRRLEIQGVGYRAQLNGKNLTLNMGYSNPVEIEPPPKVEFSVEDNAGKAVKTGTLVVVSGIDKEVVGNMAAKIRAVRPREVYKGKGIRYVGEFVRRKAGKAGKK